MKNLSKTKGFTLIELVVVIVILGILAATAAPKFIDLTGDARQSVVEGVQGSVNSAINMTYAKALVSNQVGDTGSVVINGIHYALVNGYPAIEPDGGTNPLSAATNQCGTADDEGCGIQDLIDLSDGAAITYDEASGDFEHSEGTDPDNCKVTYAQATAAGGVVTPASATLTVTDC